MRIGYITYGLDRTPTGIGRYAVEMLRAFAALPNAPEIVLLTTERADNHELWQQFERHPLPGCRLLPGLITVGNAALRWAANRYNLALIHDPNGIAPFLGLSGAVRRVVTIHDAFPYILPETHNRLDTWRYRWMLPYAARRSDAVITDSYNSRTDLIRHLGLAEDRVRPIHLAINPRFAPLGANVERSAVLARYRIARPYLLYIGGINARKNIARLFEAFALVRQTHPGVMLVIGGKRQWQTTEIEAAFQRLRLENDVHFTGYVADEDLPALYSAAEAFVFPSLYEGFGLPPLEAMACGTPVITSNTSSLPEVVGDAAITVDPYDTGALAAAMQLIITDATLRAELRQRGAERAAQFTWERAARETMGVYQQVLEQAPNTILSQQAGTRP